MSTSPATRPVEPPARHRLTIAGVVAAALLVTSTGSYAVLRTATPDLPLVPAERIEPEASRGVGVATRLPR